MKKVSKFPISRLCILTGICVLFAAVIILMSWMWRIQTSQEKAADYVHAIRMLMPEPQGAILEERRDNSMSVLSMDGTSFAGILEMPGYGSALPVCADWGEVTKYPCRLSGSIYERTMQIGATSQAGQYDFYREISVGDSVFFTDMEGNRFSYEVTAIRFEKHADQSTLQREDAALTVFVKNIFGFEYIVIFCNAA